MTSHGKAELDCFVTSILQFLIFAQLLGQVLQQPIKDFQQVPHRFTVSSNNVLTYRQIQKKKKSIKAEPEQESRLLPAAKLASQLDSRFVTARSKLICSTKGPVFPQFLGRGGLISCKHQALSPTGETPCASLDHHLTGSERDVLSVC